MDYYEIGLGKRGKDLSGGRALNEQDILLSKDLVVNEQELFSGSSGDEERIYFIYFCENLKILILFWLSVLSS